MISQKEKLHNRMSYDHTSVINQFSYKFFGLNFHGNSSQLPRFDYHHCGFAVASRISAVVAGFYKFLTSLWSQVILISSSRFLPTFKIVINISGLFFIFHNYLWFTHTADFFHLFFNSSLIQLEKIETIYSFFHYITSLTRKLTWIWLFKEHLTSFSQSFKPLSTSFKSRHNTHFIDLLSFKTNLEYLMGVFQSQVRKSKFAQLWNIQWQNQWNITSVCSGAWPQENLKI